MLTDAGLTPDAVDYRNADHASRISKALQAFVVNYHTIFEEDRNVTYAAK